MSSSKLDIQVKGCSSHGSVDDFELAFSRRSLALLKRLLGREGISKLLVEELKAGRDNFWKAAIANSNGEKKKAEIELTARGITLDQMLSVFHKRSSDEAWMLAAHPEHFVLHPTSEEGGMHVVEVMGTHMTSVTMHLSNNDPGYPGRRPDYPVLMSGKGYADDGTFMGEIRHQFRNHEDGGGFDAVFCAWFPASAGEEFLETHRRHLAVEFRNWTAAAYEELKTGSQRPAA